MIRPPRLLAEFLASEQAGGVILLACTVLSLSLANSALGGQYVRAWQADLCGHPAVYWINDGLMAIFFLLIGLELKRELRAGELASVKKAALPVIAALGGMIAPAAIYLSFTWGTPLRSGAGIPVATDIAFSLAALSLLGKRVPAALRIFLTAFAVIDDLGAIIVIALFYRGGLSWAYLGLSAALVASLLAMNRLKVRALAPYLAGGALLWYCLLHSGVHATLAGVLLAFTIPNGGVYAPASRLERFLTRPVAFFVLPLFALANTCLSLPAHWHTMLASTSTMGIMLGLVLGKPLGIMLASLLAVKTRLCRLPSGVNWRYLTGAGMLGGIGFTMSIFIALLAFPDAALAGGAKLAVLASSLVSGTASLLWLRFGAGGRQLP